MCAKTTLNMEITQAQMSYFIPNACVNTVDKIMPLQHFTKKCMESRVPKLFIKRWIWLTFNRRKGCSVLFSKAKAAYK